MTRIVRKCVGGRFLTVRSDIGRWILRNFANFIGMRILPAVVVVVEVAAVVLEIAVAASRRPVQDHHHQSLTKGAANAEARGKTK